MPNSYSDTSSAELSPLDGDEAAGLIDAIGSASFFEKLHAYLLRTVDFQNFIVLFFETGRTAEILHTNLALLDLRAQMASYLDGLYELDPFFIASSSGDERLFIVMDEVAPEEFIATEFYKNYYTTIDLTQETRFVVPLRPGRWLHLLAERERPAPMFSAEERAALRRISRTIAALARKHYEFGVIAGSIASHNRALAANLFQVIGQLRSGVLSAREVEIAESLLQGHSPKSVARRLGISVDTVINHKRHIYRKLEVHSQAQLFNMVIAALFGTPRTDATAKTERAWPRH